MSHKIAEMLSHGYFHIGMEEEEMLLLVQSPLRIQCTYVETKELNNMLIDYKYRWDSSMD